MLVNLIRAMDGEKWRQVVVSLMDVGAFGAELERLGVSVHCVGLPQGRLNKGAFFRLRTLMRSLKPDLLQGWMYHGNLGATVGSWFAGSRTPVIWNIRQSLYDLRKEKVLTRFVIRTGSKLSCRTAAIVYNAKVSKAQHEAAGFCRERGTFIPNGFDLGQFWPARNARHELRRRLGLKDDAVLVGSVARFHPMKDHRNFLRALSRVSRGDPSVNGLMVGAGMTKENEELLASVNDCGLVGRVHFLGERRDLASIMAGLDVLCSASAWGEGFPNAVGEAMACAVPCVVTDVGDSSDVVGDAGYVVAPGDPYTLADALQKLTAAGLGWRQELGIRARRRIEQHYSIESIADQYAELYRRALAKAH
jgi:glycosyltransferase involved in cell wall biosynthesis